MTPTLLAREAHGFNDIIVNGDWTISNKNLLFIKGSIKLLKLKDKYLFH